MGLEPAYPRFLDDVFLQVFTIVSNQGVEYFLLFRGLVFKRTTQLLGTIVALGLVVAGLLVSAAGLVACV